MFVMENACSKGTQITFENSLFVTMNDGLASINEHTVLNSGLLSDLKAAISRGCRAWVECGGRQKGMISFL